MAEASRDLTAAHLADDATRDIRFAVRSLRRAPAFSIVAIVTLALGIGATTAIFSVVNGVLLRGLPYPNANELVVLHERGRVEGREFFSSVSAPNFADWREQARRVVNMTAFRGGENTVLGLNEPIRANLYAVSHDYFSVLAGRPMRGRVFSDAESAVGGEPVAVVSYAFWRDHLGRRDDVAEVRLTMWSATYRVVGVMPESFVPYPEDAQLWIPLEPQNARMGRSSHNDETIARLAPGVTREAAETELQGIAERLKRVYPTDNDAFGARVTGLREAVVGPVRTYLRLLFLAVLAVLAVACVNLASANLARGASREREMTIRTVLGAGRGRLARQLLTENLLIATVGGALGTILAFWLLRVILALNPRSLPRGHVVSIDAGVLVFALGLTIATGLIIGLLPALQVGRQELRAGMTSGGRGAAVGRSGVRRLLIATEVAFAVLLLVGAGLLVRSFRALLGEDAGFDARDVLAVHVALPESRYRTGDRISAYYGQAVEAMRGLPGATHAALINIAPLMRGGFGGGMNIIGRPEAGTIYADYRLVTPDYFAAMRIPVLAGRLMTDADDSTSEHVTVINQAMARRFFGDENPLGKQLRELGMDRHRDVPLRIVGVVGDVRGSDLSRVPGPQHFISVRQRPERGNYGTLVLRTNVAPASLGPIARSRLRAIDANVLTSVETYGDIRARSVGDRRFTMVLLSGFALLGLVLAAIGIYGVLAYSVARRTREIGVRMALGAVRGRVVRMVLADSLTPVIAGAAAGLVVALFATRLMRSLLYSVSPTDPLTFALVVAVLLGVAVLASALPASRAAKVEPVIALRED